MNLFSDFSSGVQAEVKNRLSNVQQHIANQVVNAPKLIVDKVVQQGNLSAKQLAQGLKPAAPRLAAPDEKSADLARSASAGDTGSKGSMMKWYLIGGAVLVGAYFFMRK